MLQAVAPADIRATPGAWTVVYPGRPGGAERVLLLGAGPREGLTSERVRRFAGHAVRAAEQLGVSDITLYVRPGDGAPPVRVAEAAATGAGLAAWRFTELLTDAALDPGRPPPVDVARVTVMLDPEHAAACEEGVRVGGAVARAQNLARALQCRPGNLATPSDLAREATRIAEERGLAVTVFGPDRIREERMNALLAVSQGSDQEPRLIVLEHRRGIEGEAPLVLVGKGLTFDAGGISLKPAKGMEDMKYDMSAGAAVLGALHAAAELDLPLNVVGVVPSSENLVSGRALKPGDVVHTRSRRTVEVVNTDAEGRLILCDALDWALGLEPAAIVDCATLTGAVVVALGHHAAAVLGTDEALVEELRAAGDESGERCWPLPLWEEYRRQLESGTADLKNVGGRPAGTITAAWFLRQFVGEVPWAHL
ncbi:MAG TPA: leucyl aminopeptidase, partial [Longimicrobiales bacterium]|nr:leucyl aminopeptidase [Longimicrobiales bacterium]